jgi:hypothetical protein
MRYCHSCGLSISETATFCATCGTLVPVAEEARPDQPTDPALQAPELPTDPAPLALAQSADPAPETPVPLPPKAAPEAPDGPTCRLCGRATPGGATPDDTAPDEVCLDCAGALAAFVTSRSDDGSVVSLAAGDGVGANGGATAVNAIYSAFADADTCPECLAMDGGETADVATARAWAPNPRCTSRLGCRCAVFFEHESLADGEQGEFVEFASARGLGVTAQAVAAFHEDRRRLSDEADRRQRDTSRLLEDARDLEKPDPQQAVTLYREAIDGLMGSSESPLAEPQVRRDLLHAFNRLTIVLKIMGREAEALGEIDRATSWGLLDDSGSGRKADREAVRNRGRRLREALGVLAGD